MSEDKHEVSAALGRADALVQALRERGAAGPLQVAVETSEDEQPSVVLSAPRSRAGASWPLVPPAISERGCRSGCTSSSRSVPLAA